MSHKMLSNVIIDGVTVEEGTVVDGLDEAVATNLVERGLAEVSKEKPTVAEAVEAPAEFEPAETQEQTEETATESPLVPSEASLEESAPAPETTEVPQPSPEQIQEDLANIEVSPAPQSNVQIN